MSEFERRLQQHQAKETQGKLAVGKRAVNYPSQLASLYADMEQCFKPLRATHDGVQTFQKDVTIKVGDYSQTVSLPYLRLSIGAVKVEIAPDAILGDTLIVRVAGKNSTHHFNVVKEESEPSWSIQKPGSDKQWYSDVLFDHLLANAMFE
jgi:hypothetical protein